MAADAPEKAELYGNRGLDAITTSMTDSKKLEGGVTCLSTRVRDEWAPRA